MKSKRKRRKKQLKVLLVLLILAIAGTAITIYRDYEARPGFLEKVWISDRGGDYLTVAWERPRNVSRFIVTCNGKTMKVSGRKKEVKVTDLKEDTFYTISVRADSKEREGFEALTAQSKTKKFARIKGETEQLKMANWPSDLHMSADTPIEFTTSNGSITPQGDKVIFNRSGDITVKARTEETEEYASTTKEITVHVLDTVNVDANDADLHIFYKLDKSNCQCVRAISGVDEAVFPQAFVKYGGNYLVTYIGDEEQRLITFGDGKYVEEPQQDLGHANGLTERVRADMVFLAVGLEPQNGPFADLAPLDLRGYADAGEDCMTATPGLFAAGDCRRKKIRQVTTAAADGAVAALAACDYLDGR